MIRQYSDVKRVLIITGARIGDQLMATPFFRAVRRAFPGCRIRCYAGYPAIEILRNNPHFDELLPIKRGISRKVANEKPFDLAIDLCSLPDTAYIAAISGAKYRVGMLRSGSPRIPFKLYTRMAPSKIGGRASFLDRYLLLAKEIGIKASGRETEIFLTPGELAQGEAIFRRLGLTENDFVVGIFPFGSRREILWEPYKFARLADEIMNRFKAKILFFYSREEEDDVRTMSSVMKNTYFSAGLRNIRITASMIKLCDCLISGNRGPMHISAALKVPTIGIFGPYPEGHFFPYSLNNNLAISKNLKCRPCFKGYKSCKKGIECLTSLTAKEMLKKIGPFLKKSTQKIEKTK